MKRSKRIEALDRRPVNLDGYIDEWPEMGFVAMSSPYDPKPSVRVEGGKIVELDGSSVTTLIFLISLSLIMRSMWNAPKLPWRFLPWTSRG